MIIQPSFFIEENRLIPLLIILVQWVFLGIDIFLLAGHEKGPVKKHSVWKSVKKSHFSTFFSIDFWYENANTWERVSDALSFLVWNKKWDIFSDFQTVWKGHPKRVKGDKLWLEECCRPQRKLRKGKKKKKIYIERESEEDSVSYRYNTDTFVLVLLLLQ